MAEFVTPQVEIGQMVIWHPDAEKKIIDPKDFQFGFVTAIGMNSLNINIFSPRSYNMTIKDGVRHIDDPLCRRQERGDEGAWEHTPATKRLQVLTAKVEMLFAKVAREGDKEFAEQARKDAAAAAQEKKAKDEREAKDKKGQ